MSVLAQIGPQLTEALGDVSMIGGLALAFYVAFFIFKMMRAGVHPSTIKRHGEVYELDTSYTPKLPKYQYLDGQRYVLKEPEDLDDPYELDGDETPDSELLDQVDDQIWANAVENSRQDFNGESDDAAFENYSDTFDSERFNSPAEEYLYHAYSAWTEAVEDGSTQSFNDFVSKNS